MLLSRISTTLGSILEDLTLSLYRAIMHIRCMIACCLDEGRCLSYDEKVTWAQSRASWLPYRHNSRFDDRNCACWCTGISLRCCAQFLVADLVWPYARTWGYWLDCRRSPLVTVCPQRGGHLTFLQPASGNSTVQAALMMPSRTLRFI
jgi:hypothetical protein